MIDNLTTKPELPFCTEAPLKWIRKMDEGRLFISTYKVDNDMFEMH